MKGIAVFNGLPVTPEEFEAKRKPFCLLCGQPTVSTCLYFPGPSSRIAHPQGRGRAVIYSLCDGCHRRYEELLPVIQTVLERQVIASLQHIRQTGALQLKGHEGRPKHRSRHRHRSRRRGCPQRC